MYSIYCVTFPASPIKLLPDFRIWHNTFVSKTDDTYLWNPFDADAMHRWHSSPKTFPFLYPPGFQQQGSGMVRNGLIQTHAQGQLVFAAVGRLHKTGMTSLSAPHKCSWIHRCSKHRWIHYVGRSSMADYISTFNIPFMPNMLYTEYTLRGNWNLQNLSLNYETDAHFDLMRYDQGLHHAVGVRTHGQRGHWGAFQSV